MASQDPAAPSSPHVSVIVPTYDRPRLLLRALESVERQTLRDYEVIVVDDGSTRDLSAAFDRFPGVVRIRHEENRGASAARNSGARVARGRYLIFLDSDDEWLPRLLERLVQRLEDPNRPADVAYCARWYVVDDGAARGKRCAVQPFEDALYDRLLDRSWTCCPTSFFMVRRDVVPGGEWFDEDLPSSQDTDLILRLARVARFGAVDEVLGVYHFHDDMRISTHLDRQVAGKASFLAKLTRLLGAGERPPLWEEYARRLSSVRAQSAIRNGRWRDALSEARHVAGWDEIALRETTRLALTALLGPRRLRRLLRAWRCARWSADVPPPAEAPPTGAPGPAASPRGAEDGRQAT